MTMTQTEIVVGVKEAAEAVLARSGIGRNEYLRALEEGTMTVQGFRRTQEQFYFAVVFYPRPMAALAARLPEPEDRVEVLHNLVEEHGDFREGAFHKNTFRAFLESIGSEPGALSKAAVWPELRAFNAALAASCALDEVEAGAACMGIIELAFAGVSSRIGAAALRRGWVPEGKLAHYSLHASLDLRHAEDFFKILEPAWADPRRRYYVSQGLELGAYLFNRLYADLHRRSLPWAARR
jgi:pyrroloquinoline-quinone synthase